jgi:predicted RNase H-like nuclease (RuvC/YqgF family)
MPFDWGTALISGGGGTVLASVIGAIRERRKLGADVNKTEADAASVLSEAATALVEPLSRRIRDLEDQLDRVKGKANALEDQLDACRASNRAKDQQLRERDQQIAQLTRRAGGS